MTVSSTVLVAWVYLAVTPAQGSPRGACVAVTFLIALSACVLHTLLLLVLVGSLTTLPTLVFLSLTYAKMYLSGIVALPRNMQSNHSIDKRWLMV